MPSNLLDQFGNNIDRGKLTQVEAAPQLTGVRTLYSSHPSRGLTPQRLASHLVDAELFDATQFLELAEDMEEKDLHYRAVLGTRKLAVSQLDLTVEAASTSAADVANADLVRAALQRHDVEDVLFDLLDGLGKGYAIAEMIWETNAKEWMPKCIEWRDPKFFIYDRENGTTLLLRDGAQWLPLTPYKYLYHRPKSKSGLPIRGGLSRAAAWVWLFKNFSVKDWVVFAELYGQPIRIGRYQPGASEDEKALLVRAVSSIGSDAAAVMPQSMMIEFIEAKTSGNTTLYKDLARYLDEQTSKLVLGQTATTEVSADGGSRALGDVHNEVRRDIQRSDARQLAKTLTRDFVRPIVDLNRGPQTAYPTIKVGLPDELSVLARIKDATSLVPYGLRISAKEVRDPLGFSEPKPGEELLLPPVIAKPEDPKVDPNADPQVRPIAARLRRSANATAPGGREDAIDALVIEALAGDEWQPVMAEVAAPIRAAIEGAETMAEMKAALADLQDADPARFTRMLTQLQFVARLAGELDEPLDPEEPTS